MVIIAGVFIGLTVRSNEEITPNDQFFKLSIGPTPRINASDYILRVDGLVKQPFELNYTEIKELPRISEDVTLDCVTGRSGRANWTGYRFNKPVGPRSSQRHSHRGDVLLR